MGSMAINSCNTIFCINEKIKKDIPVDNDYRNSYSLKKIVLIQSRIRGFLARKIIYNFRQIKEISIDYNTEKFEKNPVIVKLNHLLPKFELTDKEEYEVNNSCNKIIALIYPNKSIYKGMINSLGQREGFGKYFMSDGSIYKGFFHNNKMEGRGRLININGYIYEGEFKNDLSNGYGKSVSIDGTTYKGTWGNNKRNGFGSELYPDGSQYNGNFIKGKKNGFGKLTFRDKNIYEGNFNNNEIIGEGAFYWKDGRIYIGNWRDNKMNGYGIFTWPDKKRYYGNYVNNLKEGFGIFYWSDGHKYEGFWKEGKQHGYGMIIGSKGTKYGEWVFGKVENNIEEEKAINIIIKEIEKVKKQKEFTEFQNNIEKYEKQIIDGSSSQDTNLNSRGINRNLQNYNL